MNTEHFADTNLRVSDSLRKTWLKDWTHYFHITSSSLLIHLFTQPYVLKDGRLLVDTWKRLGEEQLPRLTVTTKMGILVWVNMSIRVLQVEVICKSIIKKFQPHTELFNIFFQYIYKTLTISNFHLWKTVITIFAWQSPVLLD